MNKDIELSIAALVLAILSAEYLLDAGLAFSDGNWALAIWKGACCIGCAFLTRAVWRAA